jgi:hypothetical protein
MTTLGSFNHMLQEFVAELSATFPDYPQITLFKAALPGMLKENPRQGLDTFMAATSPHGEKIMQNDESFFEEDINLGMGLKLNDLWHADGLDTDTRKAIFSYVSTLYVLGMTIQNLDPKILDGIEDIAKNAAATVKETGSLDIAGMLPQMMSQVGNLMGVDTPDPNDPTFQSLVSMLGDNFGKGGAGTMPMLGDGDDTPPDESSSP